MSRSQGHATAQHFPEFAQNLENCLRKLKIYAFDIFLKDSHILCDFRCYFSLFLAQNFRTKVLIAQTNLLLECLLETNCVT